MESMSTANHVLTFRCTLISRSVFAATQKALDDAINKRKDAGESFAEAGKRVCTYVFEHNVRINSWYS